MVKYLVRKGADVHMKVAGKDALYFATMRGLQEIIKILKQTDGTVNENDSNDDGKLPPDDEEWEKEGQGKRRHDMLLFRQKMGSIVLGDSDDAW